MTNQYRLNQVVDAIQLRWDNWSEMCDFADVGKFEEGKPEGAFSKLDNNVLTLRIPNKSGGEPLYALLNDYVVKLADGTLHPVPGYLFDSFFTMVEEDQ